MYDRDGDIRRLRARVDELEEANRQLTNALAPTLSLAPLGLGASAARFAEPLLAASPALVSRDRAMLALYGFRNDAPEPKILDVYLCHIRRALEPIGARVATHWGRGWSIDRASADAIYAVLQAHASGAGVPHPTPAPVEAAPTPTTAETLTSVDRRIIRGYACVGRRAGWIAAMTGLDRRLVQSAMDGAA